MTADSPLLHGAKAIVTQRSLDRGQGRTRELLHNFRYPYLRDYESVAMGLLGDVSGRVDIASRAFETTSDSSNEVLEAHLTVILRAQLFQLVNAVVDQYLEARADASVRGSEQQVNTLLRLMAEAAPKVFFSNEEAAAITKTIALLTQHRSVSLIDVDDTMKVAMQILRGGCQCYTKPVAEMTKDQEDRYVYNGLVPVRAEQGIELHYVPTVDRDYY